MRLGFELDSSRRQDLGRLLDLVDFVIDHRAEDFSGLFREAEHEPNPSTIEKHHVRDLEQKRNAERVAVKQNGTLEVPHGNRDLPDPGHSDSVSQPPQNPKSSQSPVRSVSVAGLFRTYTNRLSACGERSNPLM